MLYSCVMYMTNPLPKLSELVRAPISSVSEAPASFFAELDPRRTDPTNPNVVRRSAEFDRIAALPRRYISEVERRYAEHWTEQLRTATGTMSLRPIQARALHEARTYNGAFCPIGVGQGKTLLGLLLPSVMNSTTAVYLTNPGLAQQVIRDRAKLSEHWWIKEAIFVVSYSALSTASGQGLLELLAPDLIIADEVHALRHATATRTKRVMRYLRENPSCRFVAMSGTITSRSIRDYAHLCGRALGEGSPLPLRSHVVDEWARALDSQLGFKESRNEPGALWDFCSPGEEPRDGFKRRLVETPGVIATTDSALGTGLEIRALAPKFTKCRELVAQCAKEGAWDGVDLDPLAEARVLRQLALGFHYEWQWSGEPDEEWLDARNAWSRAVRHYLTNTNTPGLDSPLAVANAVDRGEGPITLRKPLARWRSVQNRPEPDTVPVWHEQNELVEFVRSWIKSEQKDERSIIWYEHAAVGELLLERFYHQLLAPAKGRDPAEFAGNSPLLLSIKQHGTGRNLQAWNRNLVLTPPASGAAWEQLIARTHRPGQLSDCVAFDVLQHVSPYRSALQKARADAQYIQSTTGQEQKLSLATFVDFEQE